MTMPLSIAAIADLRHELRTPVHLIVGYTEMLLEDLDADDPSTAKLRAVRRAADDVLQRIGAALPPGGGTTDDTLATLLEQLVEPQQTILTTIAAIRDALPDASMRADADKIASAASRLTSVPRPTPVSSRALAPVASGGTSTAQGASASAGAGATTAVARILVVDDLEDNRLVLARRLTRQGHAVVTAENGRVALEHLASGAFDLVLLDVMMPEVDGFQVLDQMRAHGTLRRIPVIMISALDDFSSVVRCIECGAEDYLPKPFDPVLLRARIGAALDKKRFRDREADYLEQVRRVTDAAAAFEQGAYDATLLTHVARRDDELGRLARVFDGMIAGVETRERRLHAQLDELRADVSLAATTRPMPAELDAATGLAPGMLFAQRYEIADVLGSGGMGLVYRAHDRRLGEEVALKMMRAELLDGDPSVVDRFKNEIRLARRISHRNVVRTHDLGEFEDTTYVTMEYVRGITVRDLLATRGRLSASSTLGLARQLVDALAVAHDAGIVHRDVKPENALVDENGVLKVMDFGIARLAEATSTMTQAGMIVGTPTYMAPEQLLGEDVDGRADLYAVGVVMYECLTGATPFGALPPIALISKVLTTVPPAPVDRAADVPPAVSALVMRLLAKDPSSRPQRGADLLALMAELG